MEALQQPTVAIVGSRNASAAGLTFAERLARGLGRAGYVVVSGLARGIDQRAHAASLETGAVGVLAGGHAKPYPSEAAPLIERMVEYGAVVSEMPIEWEPRGRDFPRRNRIVSGLALGTIVVEAARGSGSLITAQIRARTEPPGVRRAGLAARSPRGGDQRSPETGRDDLHPCRRRPGGACADALGRSVRGAGRGRRGRAALGEIEVGTSRRPRRRATTWTRSDEFADGGSEGVRDRIAALLGPSPITLDELARAAEASAREVRVALMELELAGRMEFSGGDRVALRPADGDA